MPDRDKGGNLGQGPAFTTSARAVPNKVQCSLCFTLCYVFLLSMSLCLSLSMPLSILYMYVSVCLPFSLLLACGGVLWMQKLWSPLLRLESLAFMLLYVHGGGMTY